MNNLFRLVIAVILFSAPALIAQTTPPASSPEASASPAKRKHSKKKDATAATAESTSVASAASSPEASASPAKRKHVKKTDTTAAASPMAASPSPAKRSWFQPRTATPAPAASPMIATPPAVSASPAKQAVKSVSSTGTAAPGGGPGMVWVNTESGVYHKEGSRWYGKTKKGKYLSEGDAIKEGDRADKRESKSQ